MNYLIRIIGTSLLGGIASAVALRLVLYIFNVEPSGYWLVFVGLALLVSFFTALEGENQR